VLTARSAAAAGDVEGVAVVAAALAEARRAVEAVPRSAAEVLAAEHGEAVVADWVGVAAADLAAASRPAAGVAAPAVRADWVAVAGRAADRQVRAASRTRLLPEVHLPVAEPAAEQLAEQPGRAEVQLVQAERARLAALAQGPARSAEEPRVEPAARQAPLAVQERQPNRA
jgi:hypothetical protein